MVETLKKAQKDDDHKTENYNSQLDLRDDKKKVVERALFR